MVEKLDPAARAAMARDLPGWRMAQGRRADRSFAYRDSGRPGASCPLALLAENTTSPRMVQSVEPGGDPLSPHAPAALAPTWRWPGRSTRWEPDAGGRAFGARRGRGHRRSRRPAPAPQARAADRARRPRGRRRPEAGRPVPALRAAGRAITGSTTGIRRAGCRCAGACRRGRRRAGYRHSPAARASPARAATCRCCGSIMIMWLLPRIPRSGRSPHRHGRRRRARPRRKRTPLARRSPARILRDVVANIITPVPPAAATFAGSPPSPVPPAPARHIVRAFLPARQRTARLPVRHDEGRPDAVSRRDRPRATARPWW